MRKCLHQGHIQIVFKGITLGELDKPKIIEGIELIGIAKSQMIAVEPPSGVIAWSSDILIRSLPKMNVN